ncbi:MAG: flagellar basal body rod protein FlgC [Heyndrickxia sp.]
MSIFNSMNITASALTAQRVRMDVISSNMANVDTTRGKLVNGKWQPYQRKEVVLEPMSNSFNSFLQEASGSTTGNGVKVSKIIEDQTPYKLVYDPQNPDANANGYVQMPNVDPLKEMVDLMSSTRSYEANVTVFNSNKAMLMKALEIGK